MYSIVNGFFQYEGLDSFNIFPYPLQIVGDTCVYGRRYPAATAITIVDYANQSELSCVFTETSNTSPTVTLGTKIKDILTNSYKIERLRIDKLPRKVSRCPKKKEFKKKCLIKNWVPFDVMQKQHNERNENNT